ncbi:MAG: LysM peptidoglycan-binding domain-containing protein [Woeseiaceae bacterium]|nr:LysM peptidoglycan-binding domain-containing protein [Woeseiaceae bacterium]
MIKGIRVAAISMAVTLAGCSSLNSMNPFGGGSEPQAATPVERPAPAPVRSTSVDESANTVPAYSGPVVTRVNEPVPLAKGHPDEYVVQLGDTLWDIAGQFLNDPWFWPEIWYVNPEIENPHLIYPGDVLGLVYIDGQPRITNVRASTFRLSPQARVSPLTQAVASVPYDAVSAFLSTGVILEKGQADSLPYMLETRGDHLIASAGNEIYVRGVDGAPAGTRYSLVKVGDALYDPDDNRLVGYQGIFVGAGTLRRGGDPSTVALTESKQEAVIGDRLIPEAVDIPLNFFPRAPSYEVEGRIISVVGGVSQIGQYQVVVLNRGSANGLVVGDVLSVFQTGEEIDDRVGGGKVRLPDEEAGTAMVFKVYDRISYALVMEAETNINVLDTVRNPS